MGQVCQNVNIDFYRNPTVTAHPLEMTTGRWIIGIFRNGDICSLIQS